MEVDNWRALERHPLSAEYADITGRAWALYVTNLGKFGIVGGRKIVIHEGKVIDGWQLYRACLAANVVPEFRQLKLQDNMTAEEWVETVQDHRRHETQEQATKRVDERRKRVAEARAEGKSFRAIAEEEGVGVSTVVEDIKTSTVQGRTVDPSPPEITGKDGKKRPSSFRKLCPACTHRASVGKPPPKEKCPDCKELNAKKKTPKEPKPKEPEPEVKDGLKMPVPEALEPVFALNSEYRSIMHAIGVMRSRCEELAKSAAGGWMDHQDIDRNLKQAHAHLRFAMPFTECPKCRRNVQKKCPACKGTGWINETIYGASASDDDKKWLEDRS